MRDYLDTREDLLAMEVGLACPDPGAVLARAAKALAVAPREPEVREAFLQVVARVGARAGHDALLAAVDGIAGVQDLAAGGGAAFGERLVGILDSVGAARAAAELAQRIATVRPDHVASVWRASVAAYARGDLQAARSVLGAAVAAGVDDERVLAQLAGIEQRTGNVARASELIGRLTARRTMRPAVARFVATYLIGAGRLAEAVRRLEIDLEQHPESAELWLEKARALLGTGAVDAALRALDACTAHADEDALRRDADRLRALAADPRSLATLCDIDRLLGDSENRQAMRAAKRLVRDVPASGDGWLRLGIACHRLGRHRSAERAFAAAIRVMPHLGEAHNRLGALLLSRGEYARSLPCLEAAVRLCPAEPAPLIHLSQALYFLGRPQEGIAALREAERLGGGSTVATVRKAFYPEAS
jgi:tetratricopeptide (TPR) repeat protein